MRDLTRLLPLLRLLLVLTCCAPAATLLAWPQAQPAVATGSATAADPASPGSGAAPDADAGQAADALGRESPRGCLVGYLRAASARRWEEAAQFLDLRGLPLELRATEGPVLAQKLKVVFDRKLWIDLEQLSELPAGDTGDGLPGGFDQLGEIRDRREAIEIYVQRIVTPGEAPMWLIAGRTVDRIPELYLKFGHGPIGERIPAPLRDGMLWRLALWQWLGGLLLLLLCLALSRPLAWLVTRLGKRVAAYTQTNLDDEFLSDASGPLRLVSGVLCFLALSPLLALQVPAERLVAAGSQSLIIIAVAWLAWNSIAILARAMERRVVLAGQGYAASALHLGRRSLQALLGALALLVLLQNLGVNVSGLVAGLGLGGLAVALAAQKTVENYIGGVALLLDRPVRVGDSCRFGSEVGTVEEIGLRSTRVRLLDRQIMTIPNAEFSTLKIENFATRDQFRYAPTLGLRYDTSPDQLRLVLIETRRLLAAHPRLDPASNRVRFLRFGPSSLDVELLALVGAADFNEYLAIAEDLNLRVMEIIARAGTGFALPSRTLYLGRDGGLDAGRKKAAETEIARLRAEGELALPEPRPEQLQGLAGSLDWPPTGSVSRS